MTNRVEPFQQAGTVKPAPPAVPGGVDTTPTDPGISPQDFYRELIERPDVRRILTRLAQIQDGHT